MALYLKLNPVCISSFRFSIRALTKVLPQFYSQHISNTVDLEVDIIDNFTTQLLQKTVEQWEINKIKRNKSLVDGSTKLKEKFPNEVKVDNLNLEQLNLLFQKASDSGDHEQITELIDQCVIHKKCPSEIVLTHLLSVCAQAGDKSTIIQIKQLCEKLSPGVLKSNSDFKHFLAEAIWVRGDIPKSLEIFEEVYRDNVFLRRRIRLILKHLIFHLVGNGSEAALLNTISFCERILKNYRDFFPLTCIWQACFLSEWYTNQCVALELLEKNNGLCKFVVNRIPYVVFISLRSHRTEVVYRLLEILLKYNLKEQYANVLAALLNYQFRCRDLRSCWEIIQWAIENDVDLPGDKCNNVITVLVNEKMNTSLAPLKPKVTERHDYDLKF